MVQNSMPALLRNQKPKLANPCFGLNMGGSPFQRFLGFFLLLLCFKAGLGSSLIVGDAKVGCTERERQALLRFKQGVVDPLGSLSSWGNGEDKIDCCKWRGVECNNQTGHVSRLDLHDLSLGGKIGPSLAELQHLKHLNLSWNIFEGTLPTQLGNLSDLQSLDLSWNDFQGILTTQLKNLSNLQSLDLRDNSYMTCDNLEWLSHLPLLSDLDLSGVNLSKAIHWLQAIDKMPSLTELYLSESGLPPIIPTISFPHINSSTSLAVLDLSGNGLTSSIYPWLFNFSSSLVHLDLSDNQLEGILPTQLGNLSNLQSLRLKDNSYMICDNLDWLSHLPLLTHLDLSGVDLSKAIHWPQAINKMPSLTQLNLSGSSLPWIIPTISISHINSSTSLIVLDLSNNGLTSSLYPWLFNFSTNLVHLDLSHNDLNGSIPDVVGNMTTLTHLDLSSNQLKGSFPDLSGFSQLRYLSLGFNQLNGTLPESIGQLPQLQYLDLSFNSLTVNTSFEQVPKFQALEIMLASCKLGPRFPNWLQTQKSLVVLDISTSGISDAIPNWFWNLTSGLSWLNISNNHISGTLPNLTSYPFFLGMDVSSNCLEGSIPQSVFDAQWLDLSKNMFSGSIPLSCEVTNQFSLGLLHVDLSNNRLSGELPKCWEQWKDLIVLNLANNNFSGKIKSSIGLLHKMQTLHLRNNSLTGALPSSLKNCKDLRLIDLGKNKLSGKIPAWMGRSLLDLIIVNLRSNEFNGSIPLNLCQLKKIQMLDLSSNNLSGKIPKCLNNLTAMAKKGSLVIAYDETIYILGVSISYVDNTLIQWKGKEWEYQKTLGLIKSIDFSNNKLIGEIPIEVIDLVELVSLNLSRNNLTGPIPMTIGQLKLLDFLDLSQNQLNGGIPNSLSQITGLSVLDLSNNTLSGKIPSGIQLQSFNASTYEGNLGLCGPPLLKKCPEDERGEVSFTGLSSKKEDIQDDADDIWFYGSIVLGFIIGFWGVCGTLLFNSSWRYAYFRFLSKIKDWLYVTTRVNMNRIRRSLQS